VPSGDTQPSPGAERASVPVADPTAAPADDAGWTALLAELYARRATAFVTADPEALTDVHLPGSTLLDRDTRQVQTLAEAGQVLAGFSPQVLRLVSVSADGPGRVVLQVIDELPDYRVVPAGEPSAASVQEVAGRGAAQARIVLEQTAGGWRISDAQLVG
jgi:hypothetical protein